MITITRERKAGIKYDYVIYEPGDVVPPTLRVVPYRHRKSAMKGELVTDINGRMVPLLRRITINKGRGWVMMIFPGFCWQPWKMDIFSYPLEKAAAPDVSKVLTPKNMSFAALVAAGMPIETAMVKVWPSIRGRRVLAVVRRLFANDEFVTYLLLELGYVSTIKEALESRGIDSDSLAGEIADLIQDRDANPTLKRWALETALSIIEKPTGKGAALPAYQQNNFLLGSTPDNMDELMKKRFGITEGSEVSEDFPRLVAEAGDIAIVGDDLGTAHISGDDEVEGVDGGLDE